LKIRPIATGAAKMLQLHVLSRQKNRGKKIERRRRAFDFFALDVFAF
jgi:hypothetical protein